MHCVNLDVNGHPKKNSLSLHVIEVSLQRVKDDALKSGKSILLH